MWNRVRNQALAVALRLVAFDQDVHERFITRFPLFVGQVDNVLEKFIGTVSNPVFAVLLALILVPLVSSGAISKVNAACVLIAWIIAVSWIARSDGLKRLSVLSRLISVFALGAVLAIGGMHLLSWSAKRNLPTETAVLEVKNIIGSQLENRVLKRNGFIFTVHYMNKGVAAANDLTRMSMLVYSQRPLSSEEETQYKTKVSSFTISETAWDQEIQPGEEKFFSIPETDSDLELLGRQAKDSYDGKTRIYLFLAMKYRDAKNPKGPVRVTTFCGWFLNTFDVSHDCGNRIYNEP